MDDKIPFYALDLRNISRLVKIKTKTRAQCLMVNTGSLTPTDIHTQTNESGVVVRKLHHGLVSIHHVLPSSRSLTSCFVGTFDNFRDNLCITCGFAFTYIIK